MNPVLPACSSLRPNSPPPKQSAVMEIQCLRGDTAAMESEMICEREADELCRQKGAEGQIHGR